MQRLSEYVKSLPQEAKVRYLNKVAVINVTGPEKTGLIYIKVMEHIFLSVPYILIL